LVLPSIRLEILEDLSPHAGDGFLRLVRRRLRAVYPDGTASAPFVYDEVDRRALDATVLVAHFVGQAGRRVFLRSSVRPPAVFRGSGRLGGPTEGGHLGMWELPAGLIEPHEETPEGLVRSAARELLEETGFDVAPERFSALGPSSFPSPGVIGERHFFFEVEVTPEERRAPTLDGSALEHFGQVVDIALSDAIALCRTGAIEDTKTEVGLRRLAERYP
jgi:ADP-ribose pyrophosphatase